MGENLKVYNAVRFVPPEAKKVIGAGRLKGMTDINPMWRIKTLTEQFGMVGIGWYYEVKEKWLDTVGEVRFIKPEAAADANVITANIIIDLFVKVDGEWSKPIQGIGGSKFVANERNGLYASDECWKMALTDAISVACKALGMGADVYWDKDRTKYSENPEPANPKKDEPKKQEPKPELAEDAVDPKQKVSEIKVKALQERCKKEFVAEDKILKLYKVAALADLTEFKYAHINAHWEDIKKV